MQQGCTKSGTVHLTASANAVPEARSYSPTSSSQDLSPDSKPFLWSHQGFAGVMIFCIRAYCRFLSVWRVSTVFLSPCLCSVGFLNRSDKSSDTAFRYQGQRIIHLHAALQVCIAQRFHSCQGDRIPLDFASVHHSASFPSNHGGLPRLLRSLSSSASRDSVPAVTVHNTIP